jgi:hypothetical protein
MLGFFSAIEDIWSRSLSDRERVGRLRRPSMKRSSAGDDRVIPRLIFSEGFNAEMISSTVGCSPARTGQTASDVAMTLKTNRARIVPGRHLGMALPFGLPQSQHPRP